MTQLQHLMNTSRMNVKLVEKQLLDTDLYMVRFDLQGQQVEFKPGQYMNVAVKGNVRRSYSIATPPHEKGFLDTYMDVAPHGPAYEWLQTVEIGAEVDILLPLGGFTYKEGTYPAYFFATGTGATPLISMIRHELEVVKSERRIYLYLGARVRSHLIGFDLLNKLQQEHRNFIFVPYLSGDDDTWEGEKGYVTKSAEELSDPNCDVYLCGWINMIKDVEDVLLEKGIPQERIFYERFY